MSRAIPQGHDASTVQLSRNGGQGGGPACPNVGDDWQQVRRPFLSIRADRGHCRSVSLEALWSAAAPLGLPGFTPRAFAAASHELGC